ncbi:MAG: YggS family pyridoxal phosphate-dependent enzyme [Deltaproteobacteria bacterium]|nr:YggS family pyridoxal phosphate-dependent enzyme [Deltaproteobacteria bacterium]MBW1872118.1 YggS family pyridoxal phosphate-dependent enzyme [Deltaproteobacteria bacterium]
MNLEDIRLNCREIMNSLPKHVSLVAAGKTRTPQQLKAAIEGGVTIIGHNYIQEAEQSIAAVADKSVHWHCIGHLQRNKVKKAAGLFDLIETVDSRRLGEALSKACAQIGKVMPIFVEVNSAQEDNKSGAAPDDVEELVRYLSQLENLRIEGLMTMGLFSPEPEVCRPCFELTRRLFDRLTEAKIAGVNMRHLSMGMSDSYQTAIEQGATMVRIGTSLFGPR